MVIIASFFFLLFLWGGGGVALFLFCVRLLFFCLGFGPFFHSVSFYPPYPTRGKARLCKAPE